MRAPVQQRMIGWPGAPVYAQAPATTRKKQLTHLILLLLIIAFGAALRLMFLDRPTIWGDESATLGRTIGTFADLCHILPADGFAPFHYELYWWLHNHFIMTPFMMRIVPAIAGILTIPAVYFLARMMASRRAALLAALFTACSAWMLNYSRDAKMYSEFWLFCTLNYACFLWWCKNKKPLSWWCFVASGVAMLGLDPLGFMVLGVELLWYLFQRRVHWLSTLAYLLALGIISSGPIGYYAYFSTWHHQNVSWTIYNVGQTGSQYLVNLITPFLYCYQFYGETHNYPGVQSILAMKIGAIGLTLAAIIAIVGALPWRAARSAANSDKHGQELAPEPWWRVLFWLSAAIVIPVYAWYCLTMQDFARPLDWFLSLNSIMHGLWRWLIITTAVVGACCMARRRIAATLAVLLVIFLLIFVGASLQQGSWTEAPAILAALGSMLTLRWFLIAWPAVTIALLWYYCAPRSFTRWKSSLIYLMVAIGVDLIAAGLVTLVEALIQPDSGMALSTNSLLARWQSLLLNPLVLLAAVCLPIFIAAWRGSADLRGRLARWFGFLGIAAAILLICQGLAMAIEHPFPQAVWVPRYLGAVWPPMCVGLMILFDRLPTRSMLVLALVGFLGLNLLDFSLRVFASEPPLDKIVQDISTAKQSNGHAETFIQMENHGYGPGQGSLFNDAGSYYLVLSQWRGNPPPATPEQYRSRFSPIFHDFNDNASAGAIHQALSDDPHLRQIIIWTDSEVASPEIGDPFISYLGPSWKLVHDNRWIGRDHWTWKDLLIYYRRVYQRAGHAIKR